MTSLEDGFFHAFQEDSDDALRLIYSDFLEEQGDDPSIARAELIRVQVELATLAPNSRRAQQLTARLNELLAQWERIWLEGWADVLDGWTFRRGLVEAIRADASVFLDHADDWFARWPTLTVARLTRARGHLADLAASPWLAHLRGLDLSDNGIDADALAELTDSPFLCLLQALDLGDNPIGPRGAHLLATAHAADELSELHLARCRLGSGGLGELLDGRARQWRRLDLSNNGLYRRDLVDLADSPVLRQLVALDLSSNPLQEDATSVLADSPNAANLIHLGLCHTGTGNSAVTALAGSPHLANLRSLDLRGHACWTWLDRTGMRQGGIVELSRSPLLARLRRLLLASVGPSNGWTADVLASARQPRRQTVTPDCWMANLLRESRYLMPSQLIECDLEDLWWLGDTGHRERLPSLDLAW